MIVHKEVPELKGKGYYAYAIVFPSECNGNYKMLEWLYPIGTILPSPSDMDLNKEFKEAGIQWEKLDVKTTKYQWVDPNTAYWKRIK